MNKKTHLHTVTLLLTILIVVGLSVILLKICSLSRKTPSISQITGGNESLETKTSPSLTVELPERKKLKPSTPEDLGLTVYYEDSKPKTQQEWNAFMSESYQKNRKEFEGSYEGEFGPSPYEQLDGADLEEVDTNRVRLDEKISECEEKLKSNPNDEDSKKRLENWQKLKAFLIAVYGEKNNIEK